MITNNYNKNKNNNKKNCYIHGNKTIFVSNCCISDADLKILQKKKKNKKKSQAFKRWMAGHCVCLSLFSFWNCLSAGLQKSNKLLLLLNLGF